MFVPGKVLVTGGAGFIGSHLAASLVRRGCGITVLDDLNDFYSPAAKRANLDEVRREGDFEFVHGDICDHALVFDLFRRGRFDMLIHLAARAGVRPSLQDPGLYYQSNVIGMLNLLEACRDTGTQRIVFASSSSVYGTRTQTPFREDALLLSPASPYAATKLAGEAMLHSFVNCYGLHGIALRFFTVFGPRQRPDLAINKFVRLIAEDQPIELFGDGTSGRDYTWVGDIVSGIELAMDYEAPRGYDVINLGNSKPITLDTMVELIESVLGKKARRHYVDLAVGDMMLTCADISKATRLLGYKPAVTVREGIERYVEWATLAHATRTRG